MTASVYGQEAWTLRELKELRMLKTSSAQLQTWLLYLEASSKNPASSSH